MSDAPPESQEPPATVAERMVEAISYLSAVARKAGLVSISVDLLSIREKLSQEAWPRATSSQMTNEA